MNARCVFRLPLVAILMLPTLSMPRTSTPSEVVIHAAGQGNPWINLTDGHEVSAVWSGPSALVAALDSRDVSPRALASADFDEDGVPDLVASYGLASGAGLVTLSRGNVDAIYPNAPEAKKRKADGTFTPEPFLPDVQAFSVPETPDFVGAGDFDADGHWDVVTARLGGKALQLLAGDGKGSLAEAKPIDLPGSVTAMIVGEINRRDGLDDVVVGVETPKGPRALVFEWPEGALRGQPEVIELPEPATSFALGEMDGDYPIDLAVAAGKHLLVVHGRDRRLSMDDTIRAAVSPAAVDTTEMSDPLVSVALGDFDGDRQPELAALDVRGSLRFVAVQDVASGAPPATPGFNPLDPAAARAATLLRWRDAHIHADGLLVVDRAGSRLLEMAQEVTVMPPTSAATSPTDPDSEVLLSDVPLLTRIAIEGPVMVPMPIHHLHPTAATLPRVQIALADSWTDREIPSLGAVLPMRLNPDAFDDLVLLSTDSSRIITSGTSPLSTFTVTNSDDSGSGSLREAISLANAAPSADEIDFNIPGPPPHVITLASLLPPLTSPVTIDGTTQPDFSGMPVVQVDYSNLDMVVSGGILVIASDSVTVRGLALTGGPHGAIGISSSGANGCVIEGNFIGVDTTGAVARGNYWGLDLEGTGNCRIGGTVPAARNVVSGNVGAGGVSDMVDLTDPNAPVLIPSHDNVILGNFFGTEATGTALLCGDPLCMGPGISGLNNTFGGVVAGASNVAVGLERAFFLCDDVTPPPGGLLVQGNHIGTDSSGTTVLGPPGVGVLVGGCDGATLGGTTPAAGNLISGAAATTGLRGNVQLTSGNRGAAYFSTRSVTIQGNRIGTDASGTGALGGFDGVVAAGRVFDTLIGGATAGAGNVISGHDQHGILTGASVLGTPPTDTYIEGNVIGLGVTGLPLGNNGAGIRLSHAPSVHIGGSSAAARNIISGNTLSGVSIEGPESTGNSVTGNFIGTDTSGLTAIPNGTGADTDAGIHLLDAPSNSIGGSGSGEGNLISGNAMNGVLIEGAGSTGNWIQGNYIGTTVTGTAGLPNVFGVHVAGAPGNQIGGTAPGERNVLSGNGNGVYVNDAGATGNLIAGNLIGTDPTGTNDVGNGGSGVVIMDAPGNSVQANIISGNQSGITLYGPGATANTIKKNRIGTDVTGTLPLGNDVNGIRIIQGATDNFVGATGPPDLNVIAFNGEQGVLVTDGVHNAIRQNSIHDNGALGIDLGPIGLTPNDYQDPDTGSNNLQNTPLLTTGSSDGIDVLVGGTLNSTPGVMHTIDLYAGPSCDPSGSGEGARWLGAVSVLTDGLGDATFSASFASAVAAGEAISATATSASGDTSEFSPCFTASAVPGSPTFLDWSLGSIFQLDWTPVQGAVAYRLYEGTSFFLPMLLNAGNDSCDRTITQGSSSGKTLFESPGPGGIYYYLVTAIDQGNVEGFAGESTLGLRQPNSPGACIASCAHSKCVAGGPIDPTCDPCVAQVCHADPSCCGPNGWGPNCPGEVLQVCGNVSCSVPGQCAHSLCKQGTPLQAGCDQGTITPSCVTRICQVDPLCCQQGWSASCVEEVSTVCSLNCD